MPYIVRTQRAGHPPWNRTAVADLDEARAVARTDAGDCGATGPDDQVNVAILDLSESGGTVGPLPDGYVIEVLSVCWNWVIGQADDAGIDTDEVYADGGDIAILRAYSEVISP